MEAIVHNPVTGAGQAAPLCLVRETSGLACTAAREAGVTLETLSANRRVGHIAAWLDPAASA